MSTERFRRLETLFAEAIEQPAGSRQQWIDSHCEAELRDELRLLLEAHEDDEDPARQAVQAASEEGASPMVGHRVGDYRIVAELGRGGMGTVYEALREGADFEQRVAIKLLRLGLRDAVSLARFRRERQLLARLSHPNIARLIDGGTAEDGTPWVVMELVRGRPLLDFAAVQDLDLKARVGLFIKLCRAIGHAHRKLVVHRDLKPGNVLVGENGEPQVLDFGIAKLLDEDDEGTATQARAFTPAYASPEQVLGEPVTLACDVYSLGVMLFELLTGTLPYSVRSDRRTDWPQVICREAPARPSTHEARLKGDLDSILLMALRKEPERRYADAHELADDLQRYLESRPVLARDDSLHYRLRKTVQRHPFGIATGVVIVLLVAAFLVNVLIQSARVEAQRDRALREAAIARETTDFLIELFQAPDPKELGRGDLTAAALLDRGGERIDELEVEPLVRARLLHVMGLAQANLGRYPQGIALLRKALELRLRETGPSSAETADSRNRLGNILRAAGRFREAEPLLVSALRYRAAISTEDSLELADSYNNVGLLQRDLALYEPAGENLGIAIAMHRRLNGDTMPVAIAMHNLALVRLGQHRPEEAVRLLREGLDIKRQAGMEERATYANSQAVLARALLALGRLDEALASAEASLSLRQRILPESHPQRASGNATRADVLAALERFDEARSAYERALSIAREAYGQIAWRSLRFRGGLAQLDELQGDYGAASEVYEQVLAAALEAFSEDSLRVATARVDLGRALLGLGQVEKARPLLEAAAAGRRRDLAPGHPAVLEADYLLERAIGRPAELPAGLREDPRLEYRLLKKLSGAGDAQLTLRRL